MRHTKLLVAVAVLALAGCGGGSNEDGGESTTAQPTTTTSEYTAPTTTTSSPTTSTTTSTSASALPQISGANAAPAVGGRTYAGTYDASAAAEAEFKAWWNYEVQVPQDAARNFELVYTDGVSVCANRAAGVQPDVMAQRLSTNKGYTLSGGAAVVAAAHRGLCPKAEERLISRTSLFGYQTQFDRDVAAAYLVVTTDTKLTWTGAQLPTLFNVGWFTKMSCWNLQVSADAGGLEAYLRANQHMSYLGGSEKRALEIMVVDVVTSACTGSLGKLGPAWYS